MKNRKRMLFLFSAIFIAACAGYGTFGNDDDGPGNDDPGPGTEVDGGSGGTDPSCENDNQCPEGQVCENHLCQTPPGGDPDGGSNGEPDGGSVEPDGGTVTPDGGTGGCQRDRDCPPHQVCEDGQCVPKCHGDHDDGGTPDGGPGEPDGGTGGEPDGGTGEPDGGSSGSCADGPTSCKTGKALICHVPPGNPANTHTICVGLPAVPAHLAHGDNPGCCPR